MSNKRHLAIFSKQGAGQILLGTKTIEMRLSQKKIAPYKEVSVGDLVYIKPAGGEIVGQFSVKKVLFWEGVEFSDLTFLKQTFGKQMSRVAEEMKDDFLRKHKDSKFVTVIQIDKVEQFITSPVKINKKDSRGWVVLDNQ